MSKFVRLFVALALTILVTACGSAATDPSTGSDSSQMSPPDAATIEHPIPDAGTTSEVDAGVDPAVCAPYANMAVGQYICDIVDQPSISVTLTPTADGCQASKQQVLTGIIVDTVPNPIPDQHGYIQPTMVAGDEGVYIIPSFEVAYHDQGIDVTYTCHR